VSTPRYWVVVVAQDHAARAVREGVVRAHHGKKAPLQRMQPGDWVRLYASKAVFGQPAPYQKFTGIGQVSEGPITHQELAGGFAAYRRAVAYVPSEEVPIRSLIPQLRFISNKQKWGFAFRAGFFEIGEEDFHLLASLLAPSSHAC